MAKFDSKELGRALRTLDTAPKEIQKAKDEYKRQLQEIQQHEASRQWSPAAIDRLKNEAKATRDRVVSGLADGMVSAYRIVAASNDYSGQDLDLDDPKLDKAIALLGVLGNKMPYATQVSLVNQFRGDIPALSVLEQGFAKNGLNTGSRLAHDLQRPISYEAMENMARTLNAYLYNKEDKGVIAFDIDQYSYWTKNAFGEQITRLGLDMDASFDAYEFALATMQKGLEEDMFNAGGEKNPNSQALQWRLDMARKEIAEARKRGEDAGKLFNEAMARIEKAQAEAEANSGTEA